MNQTALEHPQGSLTYQAFSTLIVKLYELLIQEGFESGQTIGFIVESSWPVPAFVWALWRLGCCLLPINPKIPFSEYQGIFQNQGVSRVIVLDKHWVEGSSFIQYKVSSLYTKALKMDLTQPALVTWWQDIPEDQPITLIMTSGSTGIPKLAQHTWGNYYYSAKGSEQNLILSPGDGWLMSLPLYHVGGLAILVRCALAGACLITGNADLFEMIKNPKLTHLSLVSTQLYRLLKLPHSVPYLKKLTAILLGGSAIPTYLIEKAHKLELNIYLSYGSTEMSSQITCTPPRSSISGLLTSGKVLQHRELTVLSGGEIAVRGQCLFQGYRDDKSLFLPLNKDGFFLTGDKGHIDPQGYLVVSGRIDHMFISGGENIQPEEIERVLGRMPGVKRVLIVPVPHSEFGFRPLAFIDSDREVSLSEIHDFIKSHLPSYKWPDRVLIWPEWVSSGLKIKRQDFVDYALAQIRLLDIE